MFGRDLLVTKAVKLPNEGLL
jgi:hypothetical protein